MRKLAPLSTSTVFDSNWINWLFKLYERQKKFIPMTADPVASVATSSTHKVAIEIKGQTYYILLTDS